MKNRNYNKIITLLLALLLFVNALPISAAAEVRSLSSEILTEEVETSSEVEVANEQLVITHDGQEITEISIFKHEKIEIEASDLSDNTQYQWQILHPEQENVWVDIYDATSQELSVSLALVENILDENNSAVIRCTSEVNSTQYVSEPVTVYVIEEADEEVALYNLDNSNDEIMLLEEDSNEEHPEFVTVTINYYRYDYIRNDDGDLVLDTQGIEVFTPYIATILYDADLSAIVKFPSIVGYRSYIDNGEDTDTDTQMKLAVVGLTENEEYTVKFVPDTVQYVVRYYFQNVYDDNYVEDASKTAIGSGLTGSTPSDADVNKAFDGFTSMYYQPDTIAADGSTVFEVYYERNYYLMDFDCTGGYGADPVYVRYGTYISVPNPIQSGWTFAGWDLFSTEEVGSTAALNDGNSDVLPATMPCYNSQYKALWTKDDTTFTVVYWMENADNDGYSYVYSYSDIAAKTGDVVGINSSGEVVNVNSNSNYYYGTNEITSNLASLSIDWVTENEDVLRHSALNEEKTENVTIEGDGSSIFNIYYDRKSYSLKFYYAASSGEEGNEKYYVIGGSTYYFGTEGSSAATEENLFATYMSSHSSERGQAAAKPELNTEGNRRNYGESYDSSTVYGTQYKYHYIYFTAKYGADISELWPCGVFAPVEMASGQSNSLWSGDYAMVSAWNGENKVKYTQDTSVNNGNQTVKGNYSKLDENLLWASAYNYADVSDNDINNDGTQDSTDGTVAFLCFWENGAKIGWSVPELYIYNIWIESLDQTESSEKWEKNGVYYELSTSYYTCDDSSVSEQTKPSIPGFDRQDFLNWSAIFIGKTLKRSDYYYGAKIDNYQTVTDGLKYDGSSVYSNSWSYASKMSILDEGYSTYFGENVYLLYDSTENDGNNRYAYNPATVTDQDTISHNLYREAYSIEYFFNRIEYTLAFDNYGTEMKSESVDYGRSLASLIPDKSSVTYPDTLEPGAYEYQGWYTGPNGAGFKIVIDDTDTTERIDVANGIWYNPTMPDDGLILFAYWKPVTHEVYFYEDYNDYVDEIPWEHTDTLGKPVTYPANVVHGDLLGTAHYSNPTREGYNFIGWFYIDDNGKKRFAPESMEIKKPLKLFAEWISSTGVSTTYQVSYVYNDGSTLIEIADRTEGYSTAGKTKTFNAKGNDDLKTEYQTGYFPETASHSILMDELNADGTTPNVYQFTYVLDAEVWYKIRYVDIATNSEIPGYAPVVKSTNHAVVTERYWPISGYVPMPGYYYQTKSLKSDGDAESNNVISENVITFYYMKDETHGAYSVEYYLEDTLGTTSYNGKNYTQTTSITNTADLKDSEGNANLINSGDEFSILSFDGYKYIKATASKFKIVTDGDQEVLDEYYDPKEPFEPGEVISATLDSNGLTIRLYYNKLTYPWTVRYVEYGNDSNIIFEETFANVPFGDNTEPYTAPERYTYTDANDVQTQYLYYLDDSSEAERTKSITIRTPVEDNKDTAIDEFYENVIIFYYKQKQVTVKYEPICLISGTSGYGTVSINSEMATSASGLSGSVAQPGAGFKFVGWYSDKSCTEASKVDGSWVSDPDTTDSDGTKTKLLPQSLNTDLDTVTYYALFEPITTSLTITKEIENLSDVTDTFVFNVQGNGKTDYINLNVAITGNGSVTIDNLPIGNYIVTELTDWSWKYSNTPSWNYTDDSISEAIINEVSNVITVGQSGNKTITFVNSYLGSDWLNVEMKADNKFTRVYTAQ